MLRAIRACASLLVLEDEHCQGWRPVLCAGLPGGFHSEGLSFSDAAPLLLSLCGSIFAIACAVYKKGAKIEVLFAPSSV